MTERFASAAELMAVVLGAPAFPFVIIEHPISSATTETLASRAAMAADECAALILGTSTGSNT